MKGLGIENKHLQCMFVDLFPDSPTNSGRWRPHYTWTYTHTHTQHTHTHTHTHTHFLGLLSLWWNLTVNFWPHVVIFFLISTKLCFQWYMTWPYYKNGMVVTHTTGLFFVKTGPNNISQISPWMFHSAHSFECYIAPRMVVVYMHSSVCFVIDFKNTFFFIGIHSMQDWTATARHGVTRKKKNKKIKAYRKSL